MKTIKFFTDFIIAELNQTILFILNLQVNLIEKTIEKHWFSDKRNWLSDKNNIGYLIAILFTLDLTKCLRKLLWIGPYYSRHEGWLKVKTNFEKFVKIFIRCAILENLLWSVLY